MSTKIPSNSRKHGVANNSDLFGTIHYGKNINLDEEGYIKLSRRTVSIVSNEDDTDMDAPISFGRILSDSSGVSMLAVTSDDPFKVSVKPNDLSVTQDTDGPDTPTYSNVSHGRFFHNLWVVTEDQAVNAKDGSTWGDKSITLTSGVTHSVEVFRSKNTICFANGNTIKQYTESGGTFTDTSVGVTLPSDFEIVGLSYSNYQMGIITKVSNAGAGENIDAYFFVWDGVSSSAGQGVSVGSDKVLGIVAYKGTWVIFTRTGQLLFFTGGGWQELGALPFYYQDIVFSRVQDRDALGDILAVEGDIIYINFSGFLNEYGSKFQQTLQNCPGGIWAYDPKVGLYQRYSYSVSPMRMITVTSANINTTTDVFTTASTIPSTGSPIKYLGPKATQIGGLSAPKIYYCIKLSSTTFSLATSKANAIAGTAINITGTGDTTNYFVGLEVYDYGATLSDSVGGIAMMGVETGIANHLIFGAEPNDLDQTSEDFHINLVVTDFENRGYFVTPKIPSDQVQDKQQKLYIKYRPLKSGDSIIAKIKTKELLGLPQSTPQDRAVSGIEKNQCVWGSANAFTTGSSLASFEDAKTAFDAGETLECEIIAGAGAGCMAKIINILVDSSNVYSVFLEEDIDGAAAGRYCDVVIDNWRVIGTITSEDTQGFKEMPIGENSTWAKFKIELRGVDTTIEEVELINDTHKESK